MVEGEDSVKGGEIVCRKGLTQLLRRDSRKEIGVDVTLQIQY